MMEMDEKGVEQIEKLIKDLLLATKVQKDNKEKSKTLKDTNQVLDACKKEYQKLYRENEALKKKNYQATGRIKQTSIKKQ